MEYKTMSRYMSNSHFPLLFNKKERKLLFFVGDVWVLD
jgi:hypothetical protein